MWPVCPMSDLADVGYREAVRLKLSIPLRVITWLPFDLRLVNNVELAVIK